MRSVTSDNEGADPPLTRGRAGCDRDVTKRDTWRDMSRRHEAEAGKQSPANMSLNPIFADNKDIRENDLRRVWVNVNILCLGDPLLVGKLKYFPIHPKRL